MTLQVVFKIYMFTLVWHIIIQNIYNFFWETQKLPNIYTNISQYQLTYLSSRTCSSREFSSKVVRSEMVSEAVVPLMVSSRKMVPAPSSSSCLIRWVFSRSSCVRSMLHLKHNEIRAKSFVILFELLTVFITILKQVMRFIKL